MAEESNFDFMLNAIRTAMSQERLDCLGHDIAVDAEGGCDYTADPQNLVALRSAWAERARELKESPI